MHVLGLVSSDGPEAPLHTATLSSLRHSPRHLGGLRLRLNLEKGLQQAKEFQDQPIFMKQSGRCCQICCNKSIRVKIKRVAQRKGVTGASQELGVREIKTHSDAGMEVTEVLAI